MVKRQPRAAGAVPQVDGRVPGRIPAFCPAPPDWRFRSCRLQRSRDRPEARPLPHENARARPGTPPRRALAPGAARATKASRRCVAHERACRPFRAAPHCWAGRAPRGARRRGAFGPLCCRPAFIRPKYPRGEAKPGGRQPPLLQRRGRDSTPRATAPLAKGIQGAGVQGGLCPPCPAQGQSPRECARLQVSDWTRFRKSTSAAQVPLSNKASWPRPGRRMNSFGTGAASNSA